MPEASLQQAVTDLCELLRLKWYHANLPIWDKRGWPDLVIGGRRGTIFRELKTEKGTVTPDQAEWGALLEIAGISWGVWRPRDLQSGQILRELEALR
jgi:hypothetical protein